VKNMENNIPKSRKHKIFYILFLLLLIVVMVVVYFRINLKRTLSSRLEALRAEGYPTSFDELNQWYSIPADAENAADYVIDAGFYYNEPNNKDMLPFIGKAELPARTESMSEETKKIISQFLDSNQKCLESLHKTAGLEYGRYPADFRQGNATYLPHISEIRNYIKLLHLETILAAENDKSDTAFSSIKSIFGTAGSMSKEPTIVSQLVRTSCESLGISCLEYSLNRTDFSDEQLVELGKLLAKIENSDGMISAVLGERIMTLDMIMHPNPTYFNMSFPNNSRNLLSLSPILFLYKTAGLNESDSILLLDYMDDVIKTLKLPLHKRQAAAETINIKFNEIPKKNLLFRDFAPAFGRVLIMDLGNIARLEAARTAIAVQRYRLKYNKLPDSLESLVPDYLDSVPMDPFDGKEIRYKKLDKGFVIYSIGADQIDYGGIEEPKDKNKRDGSTYDIPFIIER
jgi:hypothetical protein